jgi:hypothetical protein
LRTNFPSLRKKEKSKYHSDMSGGKHAQYATKIRGASGLSKALAIGGGTPDYPGPLVRHMAYDVKSGATTLTTDEIHGVVALDPAGGAVALTTPTVAEVAAAFPEWEVGCSIRFVVVNTADAAETITMTAGSNFTVTGLATMGQNVSAVWELYRSSSTTGLIIRASQ